MNKLIYIYIYIYIPRLVVLIRSGLFVVRMELPRIVFWRPEAFDCRVLILAEVWNGLTPNPQSVRFEPQTSCI